jgi:hypothetical protein
MKKAAVLIGVMVLLFSCARQEEILTAHLKADEISGERLWQRIDSESPYRAYGEWPGHEGLRPGQSPHGVWHRVYTNRALRQALPINDGKAPFGTIIVKENYTPARELDKLTVMAKVEGYSPESADWFWAMYSPEGEVLAEGSPKGCVSCHSGKWDNDYIIIKNLDEPLGE